MRPSVPSLPRRREFLRLCAALGIGSTAFPSVLLAMAQAREGVTPAMIEEAAALSGLAFSDEERGLMQATLGEWRAGAERMRAIPLGNPVAPALYFDPWPPGVERPRAGGGAERFRASEGEADDAFVEVDELAFRSVVELGRLLRAGSVTSFELTEMYLRRLKKADEVLRCVVTLTEELALRQAEQADRELASGRDRGPLHGIPWGAKDLLYTRGVRTTFGAMPYREQVVDQDATVVRKLNDAGAVLVAKLTLGALAMGDVWFDATTRNPWNPEQGSSGSSAGPAAATAAGLVGFSIGTETLGSIVSPSSRCGTTGLRPTYGRVSRAGAMALSWSMDKIGPICRSVEDCAAVFHAIHGADPDDPTAVQLPFPWEPGREVEGLRLGYLESAFSGNRQGELDRAALELWKELGGDLVPVKLPDRPVGDMILILHAEAGAAFDELTRSGGVRELVQQGPAAWPNQFRAAQLISAVDYLRASRLRTLLIQEMHTVMSEVDVFLSPSFGNPTLALTNLTGHPCVVLPSGFREDGTPASITFIGKLYGESDLLRAARVYQERTGFHRQHPPRFV